MSSRAKHKPAATFVAVFGALLAFVLFITLVALGLVAVIVPSAHVSIVAQWNVGALVVAVITCASGIVWMFKISDAQEENRDPDESPSWFRGMR